MADDKHEPQISRHHAGQHPALKSFQAFDIIPPKNVKPHSSGRPIITSDAPRHFDNTLVPKPTSAPEAQPAVTSAPDLASTISASDETSSPTLAPTTEPSPASDQQLAPELAEAADQAASAPSESVAVNTEPTSDASANDGLASDQLDNDSLTIDRPSVEAQPQTVPTGPELEPDSAEGILEHENAQANPLSIQHVAHSQEFASELQQFSAKLPQNPKTTEPVVAVHQHDYVQSVMVWLPWLIVIILLALIVLDILLDTGALKSSLPHTHFFG